jgi:peptidoglycan/LPS O-acetylase OafA/YrhL
MPGRVVVPYGDAMTVTAISERLRRLPAPVVEAVLAVAVAVVSVAAIHVAAEPDARPPDALADLLAVACGAPLLARRRWPLGVLAVSSGVLLLYYSLGYPGVPPAVPLGVALYGAGAAGYLRWGRPRSASGWRGWRRNGSGRRNGGWSRSGCGSPGSCTT